MTNVKRCLDYYVLVWVFDGTSHTSLPLPLRNHILSDPHFKQDALYIHIHLYPFFFTKYVKPS